MLVAAAQLPLCLGQPCPGGLCKGWLLHWDIPFCEDEGCWAGLIDLNS